MAWDEACSGCDRKQFRRTGWWKTERQITSESSSKTTVGEVIVLLDIPARIFDLFLLKFVCTTTDRWTRYWSNWKHNSIADWSRCCPKELGTLKSSVFRAFRYRKRWRQCDTVFEIGSFSKALIKRSCIHELRTELKQSFSKDTSFWISCGEVTSLCRNSPNTCHKRILKGRTCNRGAMLSMDVKPVKQNVETMNDQCCDDHRNKSY